MNDTLIHTIGSLASAVVSSSENLRFNHPPAEGLPFGGIGPSGCTLVTCHCHPCHRLLMYISSTAGYHTGKFSFDMFTHLRSTLDNPSLFVIFRLQVAVT